MTEPLTGMRVDCTDHVGPALIRPYGSPVDTWRENGPYPQREEREERPRSRTAKGRQPCDGRSSAVRRTVVRRAADGR